MKSAAAEVERLTNAITEASTAKSRDENELTIAQSQLSQHGDTA
jgi:chromosome segregation protein